MDKHGKLSKVIHKESPFHSSFFITNMGSIGMDAVYHHLYEFGTVSVFCGIGRKKVVHELDRDGNIKRKVYIKLQIVVDERAADGYLYAIGFKNVKNNIMHPEKLLEVPEEVNMDIIDRKR